MKKKHIAFLIALLIAAIILVGYPVLADEDDTVEAGDEVEIDGLIYEIQEDNTVALIDQQREALTSLIIPGNINYNQQTYMVTSVGEHTFSGCDTLTEIKIEENIISIGEYAFSECESLQQIAFPATLKTLGRGILSGSDNVAITIVPANNILHYNEGLLTQNDTLLYVSPALEEIALPNTIHTIAAYAFQNCNYMESITIPDTIGTIEEQAFYQCYGIHSITMEDNPNIIIENNAFADMEETGIIYVPTQEMKQHIMTNSQSYPEGVQIIPIVHYEIAYNVDGGTFKEACVTKADNTKTVLLPDVEKEGYEFLGWCGDEACQQEPVYQIEEGQSSNVVLYAKWEEEAEQEQEMEEQTEEVEITNEVYQLAKQEENKPEVKVKKKEENDSTVNVTAKAESEADADSFRQNPNEENKEFQQQNLEIGEESPSQETDVTEAEQRIVQEDHQETEGKQLLNDITAKFLLVVGILLMLAGGAYELIKRINKRKETNTNENLQNKSFKETDSE